jgi:hypothetical protein
MPGALSRLDTDLDAGESVVFATPAYRDADVRRFRVTIFLWGAVFVAVLLGTEQAVGFPYVPSLLTGSVVADRVWRGGACSCIG